MTTMLSINLVQFVVLFIYIYRLKTYRTITQPFLWEVAKLLILLVFKFDHGQSWVHLFSLRIRIVRVLNSIDRYHDNVLDCVLRCRR